MLTLWAQINSDCTIDSYQKPSFLPSPATPALRRRPAAVVTCSLGSVQTSGTWTVPGPFSDIPVEGALAGLQAPEEQAGSELCRAQRRLLPAPRLTALV